MRRKKPARCGVAALLTPKEVEELLRVSLRTVYDLARAKPEDFGVVRIGRAVRFRRSAIEQLIAGS